MKRLVLILLPAFLFYSALLAQNEVDALRYSTTSVVGTARYSAMGGSFGALGADFSTLSTNPGGIGLYKSSEFSITPSVYVGSTKSEFMGMKGNDSQANFNLGNAGFVFSQEMTNKNSFIKNFQFAFGVNRIDNFNNRMAIKGYNQKNSITDTYVDDANGIHKLNIEDDQYGYYAYDLNLAWWTYLLDTLPGYNDQYITPVQNGPGQAILQRNDVNTWGSTNEFLFSLGVNLNDRLYVGGTFGFPTIRYFRESRYVEIDDRNLIYDFSRLDLYESLHTSGTGFNMKFGMILRATDWLRVGGAIHSPTWYGNMRDEWYSELSSEFDNNDTYSKLSPYGNYSYNLETPWKALGSLGFVIAKTALFNIDYEFIDYSKAKFRGSQYGFYNENDIIQNNYTQSHNIRLGAEYRMGNFAIRGGGGFSTSPYASNINDGERSFFSGGFGYRERNFFADFAYVRSQVKEDYYLYGSENVSVDPTINKYIANNFLLTLGFRY